MLLLRNQINAYQHYNCCINTQIYILWLETWQALLNFQFGNSLVKFGMGEPFWSPIKPVPAERLWGVSQNILLLQPQKKACKEMLSTSKNWSLRLTSKRHPWKASLKSTGDSKGWDWGGGMRRSRRSVQCKQEWEQKYSQEGQLWKGEEINAWSCSVKE